MEEIYKDFILVEHNLRLYLLALTMLVLLSKHKIDLSKIVKQVYYNRDQFIDNVSKHSFHAIKSERVQQHSHDEREIILFKKTSR